MAKIRIKSDPAEASKVLKSNRPFKVGDEFQANDNIAAQLVAKHPQLFEVVAIEQHKEDVVAGTQDKTFKPKSNKMLAKGKKFKSKNVEA